MDIRYKDIGESANIVKDVDRKQGIVSVYIAAFGNVDDDGDMIMPGAYKKTISELGPQGANRIKHLKNHDRRLTPGVVKELYEDSHGVLMRSQLVDTVLGKDTLIEYEAGIITEHSQGFSIPKGGQEYLKDKGYNEIREIKLWEGSTLNAWGANPNTPTVDLKDNFDVAKTLAKLERALKLGELSDETLSKLENFYASLKHHFAGADPDHSSKPDSDADILKGLIDKLQKN